MRFATAGLCDAFGPVVHLATPIFRDYGGQSRFAGRVETVRVLEDNALVAQALESAGLGRVLVVDGGGSLRCALVGGRLAALAHANGWAGLVINGCVRDVAALRQLDLGINALGSNPRPSGKHGEGDINVPVTFGGVTFIPGAMLYSDDDGLVVVDGVDNGG